VNQDPADEQLLTCPLCATAFDGMHSCRAQCPLASTCSLVRCPHCGYEFPDPGRSRLVQLLDRCLRLVGSKRSAGEGSEEP